MLEGKQLQLLIENVRDRIVGVPGLTPDALIPMETPGVESIIQRDIQRVVATIENNAKISLYPKRRTKLPKTPREAYENKYKYEKLQCFTSYDALVYPRWEDLTPEQQTKYLIDPLDSTLGNVYKDGTLSWDLMNRAQKQYLTNRIIFASNKVGDEEKLDGKLRSHFKLKNRDIVAIHKISLEIRNAPAGSTSPFLSRTYGENEYFLYEKTGEIILAPSYTQLGMVYGTGINYTSYGISAPPLPQVIHIDYSYGYQEIPLDLMDAAAMLTAIKVFENVNMLFAQGLMSYSVQGFSASFGKGLYTDVMERYTIQANAVIDRYKVPFMSAQ